MGLDESRLAKETYLNLSSETSRNSDSEDPFQNVIPLEALFAFLYSLFINSPGINMLYTNVLTRYHEEHLEQLCPVLDVTGPSQ